MIGALKRLQILTERYRNRRRRLAAICFVHRGAAHLPPTDAPEIAAVLSGIARTAS